MTYDRSKFISAPWGGWDESVPSMLLKPNSFKQITGWLINKGRLQAFPNLLAFTGPPDGNVILGALTFMDVVGFLHTVVWTKGHVYFLNATNVYTLIATFGIQSNQTVSIETFTNKAFAANGVGTLGFLDGSASFQVAGDVPGTCFFLGKLASSLIELNLVESGQKFPQNVRWSAINNATEWDITVDPTSGSAQIPEIDDEITGWSLQKGQGIIYRSRGITIMSPTGSFPRYAFNSFSSGRSGVGLFYPYSLGNYGDVAALVAEDDVYLFSLSAPEPIGGSAKKAIFNDLAQASGSPFGTIMGTLGSLDYKAYWLCIPLSNNTITSLWVYHFDDKTWVNEQLPIGKIFWMGNIAVA